MSIHKIPSRWWYGMAAAVFVVGLTGHIIYAFFVITAVFSNVHRLKMPGEDTLYFDTPGIYRVFHEYVSQIDGEKHRANKDDYQQLEIAVFSEITKKQIPLLQDSRENYNYNDRYIGFSIYKFQISEAGHYIIKTEHKDGSDAPTIVISIKPSLSSQIGRPILVSSLYSIIIITLTVTIFLITFIRRRKAREYQRTNSDSHLL